jgi:5-methylcytosine-specific restriction endonuclease McrA
MVRIGKWTGSDEKKRRRQIWFDAQGNKCNYCGNTDGPFDVDHFLPRWYTGRPKAQDIWNRSKEFREQELKHMQMLCVPCHKQKSLIEFWAYHYKKGNHIETKKQR